MRRGIKGNRLLFVPFLVEVYMKIYKVISIDAEKIWGAKKINKKVIGEVIKFEVNNQQSNYIEDDSKNIYSLYQLYISPQKEEFFGKKYLRRKQFPFLIKYIYSSKKLSLQAHPKGKKETWLFLKDNSKILLGLNKSIKKKNLNLDAILSNSNIITCNKYDFAAVNPGTIHSILENNIVCEVQNNYDVTYRYFDWDNNRELTQKEFVENARFSKFNMRKNIYHNFKRFKSSNFKINKVNIKGEKYFGKKNCCQIVLVLNGNGTINIANKSLKVKKDETYFILPYSDYAIFGNLDILIVF